MSRGQGLRFNRGMAYVRRQLFPRRGQKFLLCAVTGKRRYPDEQSAQAELDRIERVRQEADPEHPSNRHEISRHLCVVCGDWHLTSDPAPPPFRRSTRKLR